MPVASWWTWFQAEWRLAVAFLPVALPLALATVVGGIDCTESAAAAGDDYPTSRIIAYEGLATLAGGLFGGVIQSTPYIGHPAYKAMGGRAAYTLATALFVGSAGVLGYFDWIFYLLPKAVVFPILVFVGLEIAAQSFHATPVRHFPAVALACVPALAYLALLNLNQLLPREPAGFAALAPEVQHWVQTVTCLAGGGGFIITSLLWGTLLARLIDGEIRTAAAVLFLGAVAALFGVIHSPLPSSPIQSPGRTVAQLREQQRHAAASSQSPYHWAGAYTAMGLTLLAIAACSRPPAPGKAEEPIAI
jgi:AGZA family xanthine/uracil permease-like MFS transporter